MRISDWSSDVCSSDLALVATEIVEDDDIAGLEGGEQELLDISLEFLAVDRTVEEAGRLDAVVAQSSQDAERAPLAVRGLADQPLAPPTSPPKRGPVGFCPMLLDENPAIGVTAHLPCPPLPANT